MKTKLTIVALSIASIVWVATQQVDDQLEEALTPTPDPRPPIESADMGVVGVDPVTFRVMPLSDASSIDSATLDGYNRPEQIREREKLLLLAKDSDKYFKRFPKVRDEEDAEKKAKFEINNPISYVEKFKKEKDPERIKEKIRSLDEILDPIGYHARKQQEGKDRPDRP